MPDHAERRSQLEIVALPGAQTTLSLVGEVDPATAPALADRLAELAADATVSSVVLDLAGVTFLDSSGLRVLVTGREAIRAADGELALRAPNRNVRRVLEVTGLSDLITVE